MTLPLTPPVLPQLAKSAKTLPTGDGWVYEPKWDGFRAIAFVDGDDVYLQSRNGKPLTATSPSCSSRPGATCSTARSCCSTTQGRQDFDALGQRIHPAESRIDMLAEQTPDALHRLRPARATATSPARAARRPSAAPRLEALVDEPVDLTPRVTDPDDAEPWLQRAEGVIAKQPGAPYRPGERVGMVKIKRVRTIDAVVIGWRPGKEEGTVGSLILGALRRRRAAARRSATPPASRAKQKRELPATARAPTRPASAASGDPSRWASDRELEWIELRPELVVEVTFDHTSNDRIRHGARLRRWRDDKPPDQCLLSDFRDAETQF